MAPALTWDTGTLIAFYSPLTARQFSLHQGYTDLVLQRDIGDQHHQPNVVEMHVHNVFRKKQAFVTVTSDGKETAVYIDGQLVTRSLGFGLSAMDLAGKLIFATSPLQSDSWSGKLRGVALYRTDLSAAQIAQHYGDWMQKGKLAFTDNESVLALYLFDEHAGKIIHNRVRPESDLYIPERYLVVHQTLLEPPWKEFRTQRNYLKNIFINIAGFVPLGCFFYAYFSLAGRLKCAAVATVIVGAMVSLIIEVFQEYLPTRDSGVTDLITNTLGTCVGVSLYHAAASPLARVLGARHWAGYSRMFRRQGNQ